MASDKSPSRYQGLIVHDPRIVSTNVVSKSDATTPSGYTEQGPRAGVAAAGQDSALVVRTTGTQAQGGSLETKVRRAGMPGTEGGAYVWRDLAAGDTTSQYYGWDGPQLVTGWHGLAMSTSVGAGPKGFWPDVIRTDGDTLFCVTTSEATTYTIRCDIYDPTAAAGSEWTQKNVTLTGADYAAEAATVLQLPPSPGDENGRLLLFVSTGDEKQIDCYRSDDLGSTWALAAPRVLPSALTAADVRQVRARYNGGTLLLLVCWHDGSAEQMSQYASDDLGASFAAVVNDWKTATSGEEPSYPSIVSLDGGGFLVVYHDAESSDPAWRSRRIGSAFENLTDVTSTEIGTGNDTATVGGCAWRDEDGTIYALCYSDSSSSDVRPKRTRDEGDSWEEFANVVYASDSEGKWRLVRYAAETIGGRTVALTKWQVKATGTPTSYEEYSVAALYLGGFSRQTAPAHKSASDFFDTDYVSWGKDTGSKFSTSLPGEAYLPIALPGDVTWNVYGSGTQSLTSAGKLETQSTPAPSATSRYYDREVETTASPEALFSEFAIDIDSGSGSTATEQIAFLIRFTDGKSTAAGSFEYAAALQMADTGYKLVDQNGSGTVDVTVDLTSVTHIRIALDSDGKISTWHATPGQARAWSSGVTNTGLTDAGGGASPSLIKWGHFIGSTGGTFKSRWSMIGLCSWAGKWSPYSADKIGKGQTDPDDLHPRAFAARPVFLSGGARLAAVDGPGLINETWQIDQAADYPIEHIDLTRHPSPAVGWRSVDTSEDVAVVWSLESSEAEAMIGSPMLGIWIQGANWRTGKLQGWDTGSSAWVDLVSLDAASEWGSLPYRRKGTSIRVDTGTSFKAKRFVFHNAHAGDTFEDDSTGKVARIERNRAGAWTDETTARPVLWCEATGAADLPSSGTGRIWRSSFGAVLADYADGYELLRLKIDAQSTADGDLRIGVVVIGPLYVFGHQFDQGWQIRQIADVEVSDLPGGRRVSRKLGPTRREASIAWAETAVDLKQEQADQPVPDYVTGASGGDPIATRGGTLRELVGLIEEIDGPSRPVAFVRRVPRPGGGESTTLPITRPELVIYGRIETDPQLDNVTGDEGVDEVERMNQITITEEV